MLTILFQTLFAQYCTMQEKLNRTWFAFDRSRYYDQRLNMDKFANAEIRFY